MIKCDTCCYTTTCDIASKDRMSCRLYRKEGEIQLIDHKWCKTCKWRGMFGNYLCCDYAILNEKARMVENGEFKHNESGECSKYEEGNIPRISGEEWRIPR